MRIVYMGTPDFATASLNALADAGYEIAAVVTAPDKAAGRGLLISESSVKKAATQRGFKILQPIKLRDPEFIAELINLKADLFVVVAFRMLPAEVWEIPPKGTINLHASLLPQYRGAAPINHAIINGEKLTGVSTFFINETIDTGHIIDQTTVEISDTDTAGTLHDKLMSAGATLLVETVNKIENSEFKIAPQNKIVTEALHAAPKIFRENCRIQWNQRGEDIRNFIRGLHPYPSAFTSLLFSDGSEKTLKIHDVSFIQEKHQMPTGNISTIENRNIRIAVVDGFIEVNSLQLEGKKPMKSEEFLRGFNFSEVHLKI